MMTGTQQPYDLPPEECVVLVCSYIESLLEAARTRATNSTLPPQMKSTTPPPAPTLPTPPDDTQPAPPRRSAEYVAERPNGEIHPVVGEEYGIGVGYDSVDLQRQRERIALRFSSKTIPKIPLSDYLDRYAITNGHADGRIRKYNDVRTPMLLSLAIYLDRIEFPILNELNVHRFVLAGLRIAAKFLEDLVWKHDRYSKVVGVSSRELSRLELVNNEQLSDMAFRLRKGFGNG